MITAEKKITTLNEFKNGQQFCSPQKRKKRDLDTCLCDKISFGYATQYAHHKINNNYKQQRNCNQQLKLKWIYEL